MKIPEAVIEEARELIEMFGDRLEYLGKITDDQEVYVFNFPENQETGFPCVYLYDNHDAFEISGFRALEIIDMLYFK